MRNLGKLKTLYIAKQEKKMQYPSFECSKPALYHMVDNKQLKLRKSKIRKSKQLQQRLREEERLQQLAEITARGKAEKPLIGCLFRG